ncbi:ISY1 [Symbiodinium pilosum]|uniref:ISY1 protein n=1 Tax=Symbiodinium pilosum TaxID=2952 RepID=A0A812P2S4_SYMPI|nr:ISY1 [Symbiodinium pilosum]
MAALNRWTAQKRDIEMQKNMGKATYMGGALPDTAAYGPYKQNKRPKIASEVKTVKECEHWRQDILRGVAKKIAEIQNAALGEHRIRDLNDEINKDLREKGYWEDQIKALGGADYKSQPKRDVETYGAELAAHSGYKYFGAAKDLPGVRELFETEVIPDAPRKTRKQLFLHIQPDYYGWRDEEDGMLLLEEKMAEEEAVKKLQAEWKAEQVVKASKKRKAPKDAKDKEEAAKEDKPEEEAKPKEPEVEKPKGQDFADFKAYVDVPTMQDIERLIVQKKKETLLKKYAPEQTESKD